MKNFNISEAEWRIMKVLWNKQNLTLKEISENLSDTNWGYTTIRTLVTRLLEKGVIIADKSAANNFKYSPAVSESECKAREAKSFLSKVFDGSVAMMMATLVKQNNLSQEEAAELKSIIEKMDEGDK